MREAEPGAEIHDTDPFATPVYARSSVRRLRGRLATAVTLWTAGGPAVGDGRLDAAGLTVSSTVVADGEPGRLLGLIDDESELWEAASAAGRFAVVPLRPAHRQMADRFAGLMPAPGGLFAGHDWAQTAYGPVPADADSWAGCRLDGSRPFGWGLLVEATVEKVELGDGSPLLHYHGRYRELAD